MIRKTLTTLGVFLLAVFTLGSLAEAAPKKTVHHRTRHSSRVLTGTAPTAKRKTATKAARRRRSGNAKSTASIVTAKSKTTTKPR